MQMQYYDAGIAYHHNYGGEEEEGAGTPMCPSPASKMSRCSFTPTTRMLRRTH